MHVWFGDVIDPFVRLFKLVFPPQPVKPFRLNLGLLAVAQAEEQVAAGAREIPPGSNAGPFVLEYTGGRVGPWCAYFCGWCYDRANGERELPFKTSGSARRLFRNVAAVGELVESPQRGDLVCWSRGAANSGKGHVGLCSVVSDDGMHFWTVEGNRGRSGQVKEFEHEVGEANLLGFARLP